MVKELKNWSYHKETMDIILENMRKRAGDRVIVIVGKEQLGKTTLAIKIAKYMDPTFKIEERMAFSVEQWLEMLNKIINSETPFFKALIADEGASIAYKLDFMKKTNKKYSQLMRRLGVYKLIHIICVPDFGSLDSYLREHRISQLIKVTSIGIARYFSTKQTRQIYKHPRTHKIKLPKFNYKFRYDKLTGKIWDEYQEHKMSNIKNDLNKALGNNEDDDISTTRLIQIAHKKNPLISNAELARTFNCNDSTVCRALQQYKVV